MSDVEIEYTPEQDWLSDAGKESVVWVRKEPRGGAMTVTEVGMRNEAGGQFTRLPAQMADCACSATPRAAATSSRCSGSRKAVSA